MKLFESALGCIAPGPGLYRYWSNNMSPARGLYLARAVKISIPLTAGCESTLHEKAPASGYRNKTGGFSSTDVFSKLREYTQFPGLAFVRELSLIKLFRKSDHGELIN